MPKCNLCGRVHDKDDNTYVTVQGNIYVGDKGGVIGNNFPLEQDTFAINEVNRSVFCWPCFFEAMFQARNEIREALSKQIKALEDKRDLLTRHDDSYQSKSVEIPEFVL